MLVPRAIRDKRDQMHQIMRVQGGKRDGQYLMASDSTGPVNSRRIFITDKFTNVRFLVDTGADVCVFPHSLIRDKLPKSSYEPLPEKSCAVTIET